MQEVMVSIICNTYKQEKFVRETLESFVNQKTNFAFEILVHDDASPDGTAAIIREYEAKYPELIKPIYQTENQYSQQRQITTEFQLPRVRGKYVAFCEGDDYWTDVYKLQKQVDALEAHPEIDICAAHAQTMTNGELTGWLKASEETCVLTPQQVIAGGGGFVCTASLMYRSTMIETYLRVMALDYTWQIYGSLRGGMLYLAEPMCVYRVAVSGSWSARTRKDTALRDHYAQRVEEMLRQLDEETQGKYADVIEGRITYDRVTRLFLDGEYKKILAKENRIGYKKLTLKQRLKVRICAICPCVDKYLQK